MGQNVGDCRCRESGTVRGNGIVRREHIGEHYTEEKVFLQPNLESVVVPLSHHACRSSDETDSNGFRTSASQCPEDMEQEVGLASVRGSRSKEKGMLLRSIAKPEDGMLARLRQLSAFGLNCAEHEIAEVASMSQKHLDKTIRLEAIHTLRKIVHRGNAFALTVVMVCLQDELREMRIAALYALADIAIVTASEGISAAIAALEDWNAATRCAAKHAFTVLVGEGTSPVSVCYDVVVHAFHPDPQQRVIALRVLSLVADKSDRRILMVVLELVRDTDAAVRAESLHVLSVLLGEVDAAKFIATSCAEDVKSADAKTRLAAILDLSLLGSEGGKIGANAVVASLADGDDDIRSEALRILPTMTQVGDAEIVTAITKHLYHRSDYVRTSALHALSAVGKRGDVTALCAAWPRLKDCDPHVRIAAMRAIAAIAKYGDPNVVLTMSSCIKDPWSDLRVEALSVLAKVATSGCGLAIASAISCLEDADAGVRCSAVQLLSILFGKEILHDRLVTETCDIHGRDELTSKVASLALHEDAGIRSVAARALGIVSVIGDRLALETIRKLVLDRILDVRVESLNSLALVSERGDAESVDSAIACLEDSDIYIRYEALNALAELVKLGDKRAIEKVAILLEDNDSDIRMLAGRVLEKIASKNDPIVIVAVLARLEHCDVQVRLSSLKTLILVADRDSPSALVAILERLKDSVADVRSEALKCFATIVGCVEDCDMIESTSALLQDINPVVRLAALEALDGAAEKGNVIAMTAISACLTNDHEDVNVRRAAVLALSKGAQDFD